MATRMQQRRATSSEWDTLNPVLAVGEIGYDTTNDSIRIGDGETQWNSLPTVSGPPGPTGPAGPIGPVGSIGIQGVKGDVGPTGGNVTVTGPTSPSGPVAGQLWFDNTDGRLYVYYNDANSSQWVQVNVISP